MKNFYFLFFSQMVSLSGSVLNSVVSMFWVYSITGSLSGSILSGFFPVAVYFLMSAFAAAMVDRGSKKKFVLLGEAVQALVFVAFFLMAKHEIKNLYTVYALQGLIGMASAFFSPAIAAWEMGYIRDVYHKLAGKMHVVTTVLNLSFTLIGGLLAARVPFHYIFLYNAVSFAAAFLIEAFITEPVQAAPPPKAAGPGHLLSDMAAGLRYIISEKPAVFLSILLLSLINMFFAPLANVMPVFVKAGLNLGPDAFSYTMIASMAGSMAAGFAAGKFGKLSVPMLLFFCVADAGLCLLMYFINGLVPLLLVMVVVGFIVSLMSIAVKIEVSTVKPEYYCKVQSLSENIASLLVPVGILMMSALAGSGGVRMPFLFSGIALLAIAGLFGLLILSKKFKLGFAAANPAVEGQI
ncbi:MAG: hypothetical protein A2270_03890 [Elusimicrobia bacterium RIFOXYA12_FULL_51_18]|nr:MAG: hypothetical protein A2270_03890 [Elusimicrobia bacterium RIFOXYA12_FULL_51_18]OGS29892.1 MAG: hypothetical protein A2218_02590 [Elusimicrobia bacterium RIFOXYA2_FULL_53_38]